jgi:hypothetical protein
MLQLHNRRVLEEAGDKPQTRFAGRAAAIGPTLEMRGRSKHLLSRGRTNDIV